MGVLIPLLLLGSCSTGTDPGDCMSIECLPITYDLTIWEDRFVVNDSAIVSYSAQGRIRSHTGIVERVEPEYKVYLNGLWLWSPEEVIDARTGEFYLGHRTDSIYVAPPGGYNVWLVFKNGGEALFDSIRTPADPIAIVSHREGDLFDPDEDLVLRLGGDLSGAVSFNMQFAVFNDAEFYDIDFGEITEARDEIVIPASAFASLSGEEFRFVIYWTQIYRSRYLNRQHESVSLNYTIRRQMFLSAQP